MNNKIEFYVYAYLRQDGTPYYIGKGCKNRAVSRNHGTFAKPPKDKSRIVILNKNLTEDKAFEAERLYIAIFGRKDLGTGILRNLTSGGEGLCGHVFTEDHKEKIRNANIGISRGKGIPKSIEHRHHISNALSGKSRPWITGEKNPMWGRKRPDLSERNKKNAGKKRGPRSIQHRQKLSEALKGRLFSDQHRKNLSISHRGKSHAPTCVKTFIFTSPSGIEFIVTGRLAAFCKEQGINIAMVLFCLKTNGKPSKGSFVGWKVARI